MNNSSKKYQSQSELEEQLILKHYGLAVSQALRFIGNDKQLLEDYIQVGLIGLLKAVRKYDKNRSKFSTFATTCIKNELINFVNRSLKRDKKINVIYNSDLLSTLSEKYVADPTDCFETINDLFRRTKVYHYKKNSKHSRWRNISSNRLFQHCFQGQDKRYNRYD